MPGANALVIYKTQIAMIDSWRAKIDLASIPWAVLLSHGNILNYILVFFTKTLLFKRKKWIDLNILILFWKSKLPEDEEMFFLIFFPFLCYAKTLFFTFMGVKLSIVNNHVCDFHNNKLHHFVCLKWMCAHEQTDFCLCAWKKKVNDFLIKRLFFLLLSIVMYASICLCVYFCSSNSVNLKMRIY